MMRKRTFRDETEHLSEKQRALAERYTIDRAEAQRREQVAAEAAAAEVDEQTDGIALAQAERAGVEHEEPVTEPEFAPRPNPPDANDGPAVPQRAVSYPNAFSARRRFLLLGTTVAAAAFYAADWQSPVRVAVTIAALLFLPGLALAELAPLADAVERLVVAIGASLALETLVAVVFLYAGFFTTDRVFAVCLAATVGFTAVAALRTRQPL